MDYEIESYDAPLSYESLPYSLPVSVQPPYESYGGERFDPGGETFEDGGDSFYPPGGASMDGYGGGAPSGYPRVESLNSSRGGSRGAPRGGGGFRGGRGRGGSRGSHGSARGGRGGSRGDARGGRGGSRGGRGGRGGVPRGGRGGVPRGGRGGAARGGRGGRGFSRGSSRGSFDNFQARGGSRGRGRGGFGSRGGNSRGLKRQASISSASGASAKKRAIQNAPGLSIANVILLSGVPGSDHELLSSIRFSLFNNTLRVGRMTYCLSVSIVSSDKDRPMKLEFEIAQSDLTSFHLVEVDEPEANATESNTEQEHAEDSGQQGSEPSAKAPHVAKRVANITSRLVITVRNPVSVQTEDPQIIPTSFLKNARVFIFEFRPIQILIYPPKEFLRNVLLEGPLVGYDNTSVWPLHGQGSMQAVMNRFVEESHEQIKHGARSVPCPDCGQERLRRNLERHSLLDCPKRSGKCEHCQEMMSVGEVSVHQETECLYFPMKCEHGCPKEVLRRNMAAHMSRCTNIPVSCRYQSLGCVDHITQSQLSQHYSNRAPYHIELLESKLNNVEERFLERIANLESRLPPL